MQKKRDTSDIHRRHLQIATELLSQNPEFFEVEPGTQIFTVKINTK